MTAELPLSSAQNCPWPWCRSHPVIKPIRDRYQPLPPGPAVQTRLNPRKNRCLQEYWLIPDSTNPANFNGNNNPLICWQRWHPQMSPRRRVCPTRPARDAFPWPEAAPGSGLSSRAVQSPLGCSSQGEFLEGLSLCRQEGSLEAPALLPQGWPASPEELEEALQCWEQLPIQPQIRIHPAIFISFPPTADVSLQFFVLGKLLQFPTVTLSEDRFPPWSHPK